MSNDKKSIDRELIRDLAVMLKDTDLSEIEVEQGELRIRVARNTVVPTAIPAPVQAVEVASSGTGAAPASQPASSDKKDLSNDPGMVPSPMVGTAYLAAAPGARPFVSPGESIKEGQTVMIVEAMKTMNQIAAPKSGVIREVLVEDGQPVEFGEPLLIID